MIKIIPASQQKIIDRGKFIIRLLEIGNTLPNHDDHGLYQLGRIDHATLEGKMVVPMHLHKNDEILSYIRKGEMIHKDSEGSNVAINNQYLMMMNAGSGFYHEEAVPKEGEITEMLQIFMRPRKDELQPKVQFHHFEDIYSFNKWRLIGANETSNAPLKINSDIEVFDTRLQDNIEVELPKLTSNQVGYLYVFKGDLELSNTTDLKTRDAVIFEGENLTVKSKQQADLILFILDKTSEVSKNGLFSN